LSYNNNISTSHKLQQSDDIANIIYHPEDFKGPVLFSFRAKSFFGKKKASIRFENGEWSDKFSLDVAGSSGVVNCTREDTTYQVLLRPAVLEQKSVMTTTKQQTSWP
jgi:vacuolar protein sorting-associated protein 13A/C